VAEVGLATPKHLVLEYVALTKCREFPNTSVSNVAKRVLVVPNAPDRYFAVAALGIAAVRFRNLALPGVASRSRSVDVSGTPYQMTLIDKADRLSTKPTACATSAAGSPRISRSRARAQTNSSEISMRGKKYLFDAGRNA
jgi:hypothetical protein